MSDVVKIGAYNRAIIEWHDSVVEYEAALLDSAEAEAHHKAARAKAIIKIKADNPRASNELAASYGDADPDVEKLALVRLVKSAQVEGLKQRLAWHRAQADNLRTNVVDERAANAFQSQAGAGPGRTTFEPRSEPQWSRQEEPQEPARRPPAPANGPRPSPPPAEEPPRRQAPAQRPADEDAPSVKIY